MGYSPWGGKEMDMTESDLALALALPLLSQEWLFSWYDGSAASVSISWLTNSQYSET